MDKKEYYSILGIGIDKNVTREYLCMGVSTGILSVVFTIISVLNLKRVFELDEIGELTLSFVMLTVAFIFLFLTYAILRAINKDRKIALRLKSDGINVKAEIKNVHMIMMEPKSRYYIECEATINDRLETFYSRDTLDDITNLKGTEISVLVNPNNTSEYYIGLAH